MKYESSDMCEDIIDTFIREAGSMAADELFYEIDAGTADANIYLLNILQEDDQKEKIYKKALNYRCRNYYTRYTFCVNSKNI